MTTPPSAPPAERPACTCHYEYADQLTVANPTCPFHSAPDGEAVYQAALKTITDAIAASNGVPDAVLIAEWLEVGGLLAAIPPAPKDTTDGVERANDFAIDEHRRGQDYVALDHLTTVLAEVRRLRAALTRLQQRYHCEVPK